MLACGFGYALATTSDIEHAARSAKVRDIVWRIAVSCESSESNS